MYKNGRKQGRHLWAFLQQCKIHFGSVADLQKHKDQVAMSRRLVHIMCVSMHAIICSFSVCVSLANACKTPENIAIHPGQGAAELEADAFKACCRVD